jgi:hypothetical protein
VAQGIDIRPLDALELWNRPDAGELPRRVRVAIAIACAITVSVVAAGTYVLWRMSGTSQMRFRIDNELRPLEEWSVRNVPPLIVLAILVVAFLPRSTVSRFVRMALVLPLLHVLLLVVAWLVVPRLQLPALSERTPMSRELPVVPIALLIGGAAVTFGALLARRARDRMHAIVMLALANLLLLGLWLPVASRWLAGEGAESSWVRATALLASPAEFAAIMLVPPFVGALAYTALASNRPALALRLRAVLVVGAAIVFALAVAARLASYHGAFLLYDNATHLLFTTAMVAVLATIALAIATWRGCRHAARRLARESSCRSGVIADDGDQVVACMQITSWLRGPRMIARPFTVTTPAGEVFVPAGVEIATSIPLVSSVLRTGEAVVVLRKDDRVVLAGFVDTETGDSPFRSAHAVIPGPRGVVVAYAGGAGGDGTTAVQGMGLAAWRPSVAYMLIVIVVAVPGLLGVLAPTWK